MSTQKALVNSCKLRPISLENIHIAVHSLILLQTTQFQGLRNRNRALSTKHTVQACKPKHAAAVQGNAHTAHGRNHAHHNPLRRRDDLGAATAPTETTTTRRDPHDLRAPDPRVRADDEALRVREWSIDAPGVRVRPRQVRRARRQSLNFP